jgi:hypothetical protein
VITRAEVNRPRPALAPLSPMTWRSG